MRSGSLFTGCGGLDEAVAQVIPNVELAWVCDNDPAAVKLLAHRMPDVPNLGDITAVDWDRVPPIDILTGGFPCTDVSSAGRRAGMVPGSRSGLWAHMRYAIKVLHPAMVVIENVRGLLTARGAPAPPELLAAEDRVRRVDALLKRRALRGKGKHDEQGIRLLAHRRRAVVAVRRGERRIVRAIGAVLGQLADLGYDAWWYGLPASDIGAPHQRFRVFIFAVARHAEVRRWDDASASPGGRKSTRTAGGPGGAVAADSSRIAVGEQPVTIPGRGCTTVAGLDHAAPANTDGVGCGSARGDDGFRATGLESLAERQPARETPTNTAGSGRRRVEPDHECIDRGEPSSAGEARPRRRDCATSDADRPGREGAQPAPGRHVPARGAAADAEGVSGADEPVGGVTAGQHVAAVVGAGSGDRAGRAAEGVPELGGTAAVMAWGPYEAAVRRWERVTGQLAPAPTITGTRGGQVLNPTFVEWMQGFAEGWVTGVPGLSRNDCLRLLGNCVVPRQGAAAVAWLIALTGQVAA